MSQDPFSDILGSLSARDVERNEHFEVQVVHQLLRHFGLTKAEVTERERDHGRSLDARWFNDQGFIEPQLGAGRSFRFSFEDFFCRPNRHPIVLAALEFARDIPSPGPWLYCFNVHQHGRMAATNLKLAGDTHIHVAHQHGVVNIATLSDIIEPYKGLLCPH